MRPGKLAILLAVVAGAYFGWKWWKGRPLSGAQPPKPEAKPSAQASASADAAPTRSAAGQTPRLRRPSAPAAPIEQQTGVLSNLFGTNTKPVPLVAVATVATPHKTPAPGAKLASATARPVPKALVEASSLGLSLSDYQHFLNGSLRVGGPVMDPSVRDEYGHLLSGADWQERLSEAHP